MNNPQPLLAKLNEDRREAMVNYFLGQVAPAQGTASGQLKTADDLYQYQLIDNQVSDEVKTSWVAEAIASLQQYIHAIYNGMEPGHDSVFSREEVEFWRNWESQYSIWSANEMLQYYPENYIDPSLRVKKTELFKAFEMDINQARINDTRVRNALMDYLGKFEQVSNLDVLSGYMDGSDRYQSDYYFIGREKFSPHRYFFRKAKISLQPGNSRLNPTAWDEWTAIGLSFGIDVTHIRPVYSAGRLYLVWVERIEHVLMFGGTEQREWRSEVKLSYLDPNGMWAVPMSVGQLACKKQDEQYALLAVSFCGFDPTDATLVVMLVSESTGDDESSLAKAWDPTFFEVSIQEQNDKLRILARAYSDAKFVQQRLVDLNEDLKSLKYELHRIIANPETEFEYDAYSPEGGINQYLELEAEVVTATDNGVELNVRGKCTAIRRLTPLEWLFFRIGSLISSGPEIMIEVRDEAVDERPDYRWATVRFLPESNQSGPTKVEVWHNDDLLTAFEAQGDEIVKRFCIAEEVLGVVGAASFQEIKSGMGFSAKIGDKSYKLASASNYIYKHFDSVEAPTFNIWKCTGANYSKQVSLWKGACALNGNAFTEKVVYENSALTNDDPLRHFFIFGVSENTAGYGYNWFEVKLKPVAPSSPTISALGNGGQFLAFNDRINDYQVKNIRLNSTFSKDLIQRLSVSIEQLLHWDTQHRPEPGTPEAPDVSVPLDFDGANGRYLWELFFHVPHLIAQRLKLEFNHAQAQDWLHYIFNPAARVVPAMRESHSYWQVRPLLEEGDMNYEVEGPTDPDAIAYSTPEHYRKTIFIDYVRNLIDWADGLYRRQTRDSLSEAKLLYVRALSLMGNPPDYRGVSRWQPATLESLAASDTARLVALEASIAPAAMANIAQRPGAPVWWGVLDSTAFQPPVNESLLDIWATLASRLSNMRHNLTLDGKPMSLLLYEAMANPRDLLRAQAGNAGFGQRNPGAQFVVPPYRFMAILSRAQGAVETLMRFGGQVQQYMEQGDRVQQEEMVQGHLVEMAGFSVQLQEESLAQMEATKGALEANLAAVQFRFEYYRDLADEGILEQEGDASGLMVDALPIQQLSSGFSSAGGALDSLPNIYGLASGGFRTSGPVHASGTGSTIDGTTKQSRSGNLDIYSRNHRREQEWRFLQDLASKEIEAINAQIVAQDIQISAAKTALEQQTRAQSQAGELYTFVTKTRSTKVSLYRWLSSQMASLYFQAYDAVTALCTSVQACWQYEIGDYDTHFIQPNVWFDNYHGLTAGESLKLALFNMESAFIHRNERRLEIVKTVSLRQVFGEEAWSGKGGALETLSSKGSLPFSVTAKMLDEDYPGLYLRQLLRVSVTIPAVVGPYQDIKARLLQVSSKTVIKPDLAAVRYCHDANHEESNSANIKFNLRPSGQIAISSGLDDNGVVQMSFDDGRYLPFEGTGADAEWLLEFPRFKRDEQQALLSNVTDIIVHLHYTAVDGGQAFSSSVAELLTETD